MYKFEDKRKERIFEIISIVKLIYILLSAIVAFSVYKIDFNNLNNLNMMYISCIVITTFILIYQAWVLSCKDDDIDRNPRIKDYVETGLFIVLFTFLISIISDILIILIPSY